MLNNKRGFFIIFIAISIVACISHKKYVESFFIGKKGIQYFIKPIDYECSNLNNTSLTTDFVFSYRDKFRETDSCGMNFSIFTGDQISEISSGQWICENDTFRLQNFELMYTEKIKSGFVSRYHTVLPTINVKKAFESLSNKFRFATLNGNLFEFHPSKKGTKAISVVKNQLFSLH